MIYQCTPVDGENVLLEFEKFLKSVCISTDSEFWFSKVIIKNDDLIQINTSEIHRRGIINN